jgi:hypothetical protein
MVCFMYCRPLGMHPCSKRRSICTEKLLFLLLLIIIICIGIPALLPATIPFPLPHIYSKHQTLHLMFSLNPWPHL